MGSPLLYVVIGAAALLIVVFILLRLYVSWLHKVGPNQALIISHGNKVDVVTGGTRFVNHLTTRWQELSLELMSFDVAPPQDLWRGGASRGRCAGGMGGGVHGRRDYAAHGTS